MSSRRVLPGKSPTSRPGPEGGRRDANRRARTDDLARAALSLFLERGIEAVSIDEIASAAGVAKGSFYTYFHDKADLVQALLEPVASSLRGAFSRCAERLEAANARNDRDALAMSYLALAVDIRDLFEAEPLVARLYLQECRGPANGARAPVASVAELIRGAALRLTEVARAGGLLRDLDTRVTAAAMVGASEHLCMRVLSGEDFGDLSNAMTVLVTLVMEGLGPRASIREVGA